MTKSVRSTHTVVMLLKMPSKCSSPFLLLPLCLCISLCESSSPGVFLGSEPSHPLGLGLPSESSFPDQPIYTKIHFTCPLNGCSNQPFLSFVNCYKICNCWLVCFSWLECMPYEDKNYFYDIHHCISKECLPINAFVEWILTGLNKLDIFKLKRRLILMCKKRSLRLFYIQEGSVILGFKSSLK